MISKLSIELNPTLSENITYMILWTISEKYRSYFNNFLAEKNHDFLRNNDILTQEIRAFKNISTMRKVHTLKISHEFH